MERSFDCALRAPLRMTEFFVCALMLFVMTLSARAQQTTTATDVGWAARMAALDEERDAQAGVAVSIVFDDSGSMNDNRKLVMAKEAFHAWLERAPENDRFGLTAINAGTLVKLARHNKPEILKAVDRLRARGGTPLADTVASVAKTIHQRRTEGSPYERQVVVILTDGEDTSERGVPGVEQEIRRLRADGVEVVAFGYQGEGDYMRGSATHFFSPANGEDIARGLSVVGSEIGDTSDVVVDAETRAAMGRVAPPTAETPAVGGTAATRPFSPYASPSPSPTPTPKHGTPGSHAVQKGFSGLRVLMFFGIFVVVWRMSRRRRR